MLVKVHKTNNREVIAISDKNLIGKEFEEGDKYLEVKKSFYEGDDLKEEEILKLLEDANSINIVGEESIKFALKNKIVDEEGILKVNKIPYAIVIFADE